MVCFRCDQDAVQECPRCGALYCDDHGEAMCERCMDPMLALPSHRVYRGSLFALLFGSVVAVSLLILPPAGADQDAPPGSISNIVQPASPTPDATPTLEPTTPPDGTPDPNGTPTVPGTPGPGPATPTPTPTATATPEPTPTEEPSTVTYTVQSGDTLLAIGQNFATGGLTGQQMADLIAEENGITNPSSIQAGQELIIPQQ